MAGFGDLLKQLAMGVVETAAQSQGYAPPGQPVRPGGALSKAGNRPALRPLPAVAPCKCDK